MNQELKDFAENFIYNTDMNHYGYADVWKILPTEGRVLGDCEDYALTALYILSEKNMLKFWWNLLTGRAKICFVMWPSNVGHAVLRWDGMYLDNITRVFVTRAEMETMQYTFYDKYFNVFQVAKRLWAGRNH